MLQNKRNSRNKKMLERLHMVIDVSIIAVMYLFMKKGLQLCSGITSVALFIGLFFAIVLILGRINHITGKCPVYVLLKGIMHKRVKQIWKNSYKQKTTEALTFTIISSVLIVMMVVFIFRT